MNILSLPPQRFDLIAKYLYIKSYDKEYKTDFFKNLYIAHFKTFNNLNEYPDKYCSNNVSKKCSEDFITEFNNLIDNIKKYGYDTNYPIPIGKNNIIINGAHRLISSYYFNIKPTINYISNENGNPDYNHMFFLNRKGENPSLQPIYADTMALEYINHNPNIRAMIIYPNVYKFNKMNDIINIINNYGYIYYSKSIKLNKNGINNLVKELYRGEDWIGGLFPQGYSPGGKAMRCYDEQENPTILLLIEMKDLNKCIELKEKCRSIFNIGKHSIHISDFTKDTFRIGSSLLNENSINFLNNGTNDISLNTQTLLNTYFNKVKNNKDEYCLTSSLILEMYNLRQAKDIDYLHENNIKIDTNENIGLHDGIWLSYYKNHHHEIIYDPNNYFYINGYKFATLNIIKGMKHNRNENKDIQDINLINNNLKIKYY